MTQHRWVGRDLRHKANSRWWALSGYVATRRITSERALCLGVLLVPYQEGSLLRERRRKQPMRAIFPQVPTP